MKIDKIEILAQDNNKKGDLFGRLMGDLFHTLGYDEPRVNIHKAGRELDIQAKHRIESKIAIAECKAHKEPIGGSDINKFVGVLDAEIRKLKQDESSKKASVVGYFISLSGFKETAIEQENNLGNSRIILLKQDKIVEELIKGKILISIDRAVLSISPNTDLYLIEKADLIAFDKGWVWVIYFSDNQGQTITHFALVHAEGKPLVAQLANDVIELDKNNNHLFKGLTLININEYNRRNPSTITSANEKYFKYLENELGEIQFEGLPTDKEAGSVKVQLENIFVPLHFNKIKENEEKGLFNEDDERLSIGEILRIKNKLAILGKPGAGKSTLLKRIAISYAFPERRKLINDLLPEVNWFPIFFRCRELGEKVKWSITDIINSIPSRAEIGYCQEEFQLLASNSLQNGKALLLIDGLDEIAEDKHRIAFVNQLRTFIATYPSINLIITSREAGFRVVGGSLAVHCDHFKVSELIDSEIEDLSIKWHTAIIDNSENTIKEATKLSQLIIKDSRIKVLAENPLLLTTLLFVKRWAGYLPTKRSVLYQEMIKLLLVTWNVEGHEQLDIEEAEPQLCYVAYWMTTRGQQTINEEDLRDCLVEARKQMPEILGYSKISPSEFIRRVESRSSILIMSGHKRLESGMITQVYEFLHLSFQEYLTAKAIVKEYIPSKDAEKSKLDLIIPNINNEYWKEVIPIAAVLLERGAKDIVEYLISESKITAKKHKTEVKKSERIAPLLLGNCLANEVQINPTLLNDAVEWFAKNKYTLHDETISEIILNNKFGSTFRQRTKDCFFQAYDDPHAASLGSTLADIFLFDNNIDNTQTVVDIIHRQISSSVREEKCISTLALMTVCFSLYPRHKKSIDLKGFDDIYHKLLNSFDINDKHLLLSISWSIAWAEEAGLFPIKLRQEYCLLLTKAFIQYDEFNLRRVVAWALSRILLPSVTLKGIGPLDDYRDKILEIYFDTKNEYDGIVAVYLMCILGIEFDRDKAVSFFKRAALHRTHYSKNKSLLSFAKKLGIKKDEIFSNEKVTEVVT